MRHFHAVLALAVAGAIFSAAAHAAGPVPPLATVFQQERSDKEDIVLFRNGDTQKGEVQNADFTISTQYGSLKVPLRKCAGVSFEGSRANTEALVTTNYNRITGIIADGKIALKIGSSGEAIEIRKEKVRHILLMKAADETAGMVADKPTDLFVMANGDLLTGLPVSPKVLIATDYAEVSVAFAEMKKIEMQGAENVTAVVTKANGDTMRGSLKTEDLSLKLDVGVAVDAVYKDKFAKMFVGDGNIQVAALFGVAPPEGGESGGAVTQPPVGGEVITNTIGMKLKLIPAGSFMMGSENVGDSEKPFHKVTLTKPFYMGVTEVTQEQYEKVMGSNPSTFKGANQPVEMVSWNDAQEFCKKLSEKEKAKYRLPTEAEWEYACRAGSTTEYYWGNSFDEKYAYCRMYGGGRTHGVACREPNGWGLHDMSGNVCEWCQDWYDAYRSGDQTDPQGPSGGTSRVSRGGSWSQIPEYCQSACRMHSAPDYRNRSNGFRVVRTQK